MGLLFVRFHLQAIIQHTSHTQCKNTRECRVVSCCEAECTMGIVLATYYEWSQLRFGIKQKSFSHSHKTTLSFIFTLKGRNAVKLVCCELKAGRRTDDIRERVREGKLSKREIHGSECSWSVGNCI